MTNKELKPILIELLWRVYDACIMAPYVSTDGVIPISNILYLLKDKHSDVTKYRLRSCLKELMSEGLVEYRSVGMPAVEAGYEYVELVCEAGPPVNGYALTKAGFELDICKKLETESNEFFRKLCEELSD